MTPYRGRFAPSPTGPLHFGSLFAALVSYLDAKKNTGAWLLRIEDIDPLREIVGASELIIDALEAHHLFWDEEVYYQSRHSEGYEQTITQLEQADAIFRCPCSRKQLISRDGRHIEACERQQSTQSYALKFRQTLIDYYWQDTLQGEQSACLSDDFVLKRKEGFYAYQLAVVSDDITQAISHVVRGYDLLSSTPMQLALYKTLKKPPPDFAHFPVISNAGQKLSKQNLAKAIDPLKAKENLAQILKLLDMDAAASEKTIARMLSTAIELWPPLTLVKQREIPVTSITLT